MKDMNEHIDIADMPDAELHRLFWAIEDERRTRRKQAHPTAVRLVELASKGLTREEAARVLRISRERVRQIAERDGIAFKSGLVSKFKQPVLDLHSEGKTLTEIADTLGCSYRVAWKYVSEAGLKPNKARGRADEIRECAEAGMALSECAERVDHRKPSRYQV